MKRLESVLAKNDRIAAFGYDIGAGRNVYETIKNAEQMMYADKERYYKETGKATTSLGDLLNNIKLN